MPSSSARCAQFPRAQDKVHFYIKLRELRDQLKGQFKPKEVEEIKYTFDLGLAKGKVLCDGIMHVEVDAFRIVVRHIYMLCVCVVTEDAKRMAVKEEQYDPGYEAAYGGAYAEPGIGNGAEAGQSNGHCTFSSNAESAGKCSSEGNMHSYVVGNCLFAPHPHSRFSSEHFQTLQSRPLLPLKQKDWYPMAGG